MRPLRVAVNLLFLGERAGGVGRYGLKLVEGLAARDDIELHVVVSKDFPDESRRPWAGVRWVTLPSTRARPRLGLATQYLLLPATAVVRRYDVVFSPANTGPVKIPGVASVITMHDTTWLDVPDEWGTPEAARAMRRVTGPTVRRATRVLTGTHASAGDLVRGLGVPAQKIAVVPHGVQGREADAPITSEHELRARLQLGDGPVVLCVGQKRPYKNQAVLVRAVAMLADPSVRLVLPGTSTPYESELRALAQDLGIADRVVFPDWVSEADLEGLYSLARCVAFPSRFEGFGLPLLEAMKRAVPVACSSISVLREVVGDAALLFDPEDPEGAASALQGLIEDEELRAGLIRKGLDRAAVFTWDTAVAATVAEFRKALSAG